MKFVIKTKLPGLNEVIGSNRSNKYAAAKMKKSVQQDIAWFLPKDYVIDKPVNIQFVWHETISRNGQARDPDNIASAKKFILDAMQEYGVLPNDNRHWIKGFSDVFIFDKADDYAVEVIIE